MHKLAIFTLLAYAAVARAATYTTYIGDTYSYQVSAIAADASGNTYLTGSRIVIPASTSNTEEAITDVFVSKLDPSGNLTPIATFSGKGTDQSNSIAVDPAGNIYIAGTTTSPDFPLHNPLQPTGAQLLQTTGFLMKLAPDGSMIYATFLGGTQGYSSMNAVAADAQGNAYVTGYTYAADYQHTPGLPADSASTSPVEIVSAAFFAKIDAAGTRIVYAGAIAGSPGCGATCQGGQVGTAGNAIAVDSAGIAYIGGTTTGGLTGTTGALRAQGTGAFVFAVNSAGTGLVYLAPLGSVPEDAIASIAVDGAGNVYLAGQTADAAFPVTPGAFQAALGGNSDAFVAKLNPDGSAMVWASYLGNGSQAVTRAMAVDAAGDVWVSGWTQASGFPATVALYAGGSQFLAEMDSTGSSLLYSALFPADTVSAALALDPGGTLHAAGDTGLVSAFPADSAPGETTAPWIAGLANSAAGALAGRIAPGELISIYGQHIGPMAPVTAAFDAAGFMPTTLADVQVTIDGTPAPLLYVSDTQINAVAPVELTARFSATLQVAIGSATLPDFRAMVDVAAPGVFPVVINQDGTLNSGSNPAPAGSYVSIWATGTGYFPGPDGQRATAANQFCTPDLALCGVSELLQNPYAGSPLPVAYSGAGPGTVNGVVQINFQPSFPVPPFGYYVAVNGINSPPFQVSTAP